VNLCFNLGQSVLHEILIIYMTLILFWNKFIVSIHRSETQERKIAITTTVGIPDKHKCNNRNDIVFHTRVTRVLIYKNIAIEELIGKVS